MQLKRIADKTSHKRPYLNVCNRIVISIKYDNNHIFKNQNLTYTAILTGKIVTTEKTSKSTMLGR